MKLVKDTWFPDSDKHMASEYLNGRCQFDTQDLALTFCTKTRTVINGGAHVGLWARRYAEVFDTVLAFEPCVDTYDCLVENVRNCMNVEPICKGLGAENGLAGIAQDARWEGNTGGNYLVRGGTDCIITTVDSFDLYDLDLISYDVEGFELQALQGAEKTIQRCSPVIVCEEKSRLMQRQGNSPDSVRKYLGTLGYVRAAQSRHDFVYVRSG